MSAKNLYKNFKKLLKSESPDRYTMEWELAGFVPAEYRGDIMWQGDPLNETDYCDFLRVRLKVLRAIEDPTELCLRDIKAFEKDLYILNELSAKNAKSLYSGQTFRTCS